MSIRTLAFLILIFWMSRGWAQSGVWSAWEEQVVQKLNTGSGTGYLSDEEEKVILFINMARHDGPLFAGTFVEAYLKEKGIQKNGYVRSLIRDLKKTSGLKPLGPEEDLISIAQGHALKMGSSGRTGHQDFNKRFEPVMGNPYDRVAENCAYGLEQAVDIVLSLLIDDGIRDVGHRKNMLNPEFTSVGVAIRPHRTYRVNCVIDFGSRSTSELNRVPYQ
jgi:hypothetical protein